jgi:soluble lytic murein transglycosylase-like protein
MRLLYKCVFLLVPVAVASISISNSVQNHQRKKVINLFLEGIVRPTLTPSPKPSPTALPTPKPTATSKLLPAPTKTPTPTLVPEPVFSLEQVQGFIERFGAQYGVDPHVLRHMAVCESTFNQRAVNGPYAGLYQFDERTWKTNRQSMGEDPNVDLRFNAEEAVQTTAYMVSLGKESAWPNCFP